MPARAAVLSALRAEEGLENRMLAPVPAFEHILKCGNDSVLLGVPGSFPFIGVEFSYAHTLVTRLISRAADWLPALWGLSLPVSHTLSQQLSAFKLFEPQSWLDHGAEENVSGKRIDTFSLPCLATPPSFCCSPNLDALFSLSPLPPGPSVLLETDCPRQGKQSYMAPNQNTLQQ